LPKSSSNCGWQLVPFYQSAREVGGDFYDFLLLGDGRLGLVIGDVAGKGIPAALVMTATRTMLRTAAQETTSPGEVFARANELLFAEIPSKMFVTCFYAILAKTRPQEMVLRVAPEPVYAKDTWRVRQLPPEV
jgi:serine phosphatase RsbU (regulator of sigma subunit)